MRIKVTYITFRGALADPCEYTLFVLLYKWDTGETEVPGSGSRSTLMYVLTCHVQMVNLKTTQKWQPGKYESNLHWKLYIRCGPW